jgi:hypothetical protein
MNYISQHSEANTINSTDRNEIMAYAAELNSSNPALRILTSSKDSGLSIRCVKVISDTSINKKKEASGFGRGANLIYNETTEIVRNSNNDSAQGLIRKRIKDLKSKMILSDEIGNVVVNVLVDQYGNIIGNPIYDRRFTTIKNINVINKVVKMVSEQVKWDEEPGAQPFRTFVTVKFSSI